MLDPERTAELPEVPGVYLLKNADGLVIYVGKAKSLRARVSNYSRKSSQGSWNVDQLIVEAVEVDVLETESEVDAFLLESRLIKDIQPRYNVKLRDGKSYPYLAITRREDYPAVFIGREGEFDPKTVSLLGPFTDVKGLRRTLPILQKIFKFRTCTMEIEQDDPKLAHFRPCLLANLDMCTAPCAGRIGREDYRRDIDAFKRFLKGKKKPLIKQLEREMFVASKAQQYEKAAVLRDQIKGLKSIGEMGKYGDFLPGSLLLGDPRESMAELGRQLQMPTAPRTIEGVDIATIQGQETVGSLVSFVDGVPHKSGYRRFKIRTVVGTDDYASIREVVRRRFVRLEAEGEPLPHILLIDGGKGQLSAARQVLVELNVTQTVLVSLAKKEEIIHQAGRDKPIKLPRNSRALHILQCVRDESHRFAQHYHHLLRHHKTLEKQIGKKRKS